MTLIELTIFSALLLFLMGGLYLLLVAGLRYTQQSEVYQTVQQQANIGMKKMLWELENSLAESIYANTSPDPYIIFPSADQPLPAGAGQWSTDAAGDLIWQKWVCFYHDSTDNTIKRTELVGSMPATDPLEPVDAGYPDLATMQAQTAKVLTRFVAQAGFQVFPGGAGGTTVEIQLSTEENTNSTKVTRVNYRSRVYPKNSESF